MVGLIVFLFALLIPSRQPKDNEDNLSFILLTFSIIFVIFSPVIATMTVSGTNIFSATKQYSETYHIVGLQDGTYYKVEKLPQRYFCQGRNYDQRKPDSKYVLQDGQILRDRGRKSFKRSEKSDKIMEDCIRKRTSKIFGFV